MTAEMLNQWNVAISVSLAILFGIILISSPCYKYIKDKVGLAGLVMIFFGIVLLTVPKWTSIAVKIGEFEGTISALQETKTELEASVQSLQNQNQQLAASLESSKENSIEFAFSEPKIWQPAYSDDITKAVEAVLVKACQSAGCNVSEDTKLLAASELANVLKQQDLEIVRNIPAGSYWAQGETSEDKSQWLVQGLNPKLDWQDFVFERRDASAN